MPHGEGQVSFMSRPEINHPMGNGLNESVENVNDPGIGERVGQIGVSLTHDSPDFSRNGISSGSGGRH
jgi:hypothetical protein